MSSYTAHLIVAWESNSIQTPVNFLSQAISRAVGISYSTAQHLKHHQYKTVCAINSLLHPTWFSSFASNTCLNCNSALGLGQPSLSTCTLQSQHFNVTNLSLFNCILSCFNAENEMRLKISAAFPTTYLILNALHRKSTIFSFFSFSFSRSSKFLSSFRFSFRQFKIQCLFFFSLSFLLVVCMKSRCSRTTNQSKSSTTLNQNKKVIVNEFEWKYFCFQKNKFKFMLLLLPLNGSSNFLLHFFFQNKYLFKT